MVASTIRPSGVSHSSTAAAPVAVRRTQRRGDARLLGRRDRKLMRADERDAGAVVRRIRGGIGQAQSAEHHRTAVEPAVEAVGVAQEVADKRRRRALINVGGGADLLDPPGVHHDDAVGEIERLLLIVGDEHRGDVARLVDLAQPAPQVLADLGIERAEGFVEQQQARLDRQRAGQCDALALPARQLRWVALAEIGKLHEAQQFLDARRDCRRLGSLAARLDAQPEGDVLCHRHVAEQRVMLEDEADAALARRAAAHLDAVEAHFARIGEIEPRHDAQQRRLARPRRPEQRQELAGTCVEADAGERGKRAETLDDIGDADGQCPAPASSSR